METQVNNSEVRKEVVKGNLTVSRVYASDFQKEGTLTAELKQEVITKSYYPSKSVSNSLQNNIFGNEEFGFKEQVYESKETRVAWIDVPLGSTIQSVETKLKQFPKACLYKIMSNHPIVSDTELYAVNNPELDVTLDTFANRQVVRYPLGHEKEGDIVLDTNGKVQYRRIAFDATGNVDKDERNSDPSDFYVSEEISAEIHETVPNALQNQSLL